MKDVGNQWNWSHATTFSGYETRGRSRRTGPGGCNLALGWLTRQNFKFLPFLFAFSQTLHAPASSRYYQLHAQSAQLGFRYQWTVDPVQRIAKAKVCVLRKGLVFFCSVLLKREKLNEITSSEMWHSEKTLNYTHANHSFPRGIHQFQNGPHWRSDTRRTLIPFLSLVVTWVTRNARRAISTFRCFVVVCAPTTSPSSLSSLRTHRSTAVFYYAATLVRLYG